MNNIEERFNARGPVASWFMKTFNRAAYAEELQQIVNTGEDAATLLKVYEENRKGGFLDDIDFRNKFFLNENTPKEVFERIIEDSHYLNKPLSGIEVKVMHHLNPNKVKEAFLANDLSIDSFKEAAKFYLEECLNETSSLSFSKQDYYRILKDCCGYDSFGPKHMDLIQKLRFTGLRETICRMFHNGPYQSGEKLVNIFDYDKQALVDAVMEFKLFKLYPVVADWNDSKAILDIVQHPDSYFGEEFYWSRSTDDRDDSLYVDEKHADIIQELNNRPNSILTTIPHGENMTRLSSYATDVEFSPKGEPAQYYTRHITESEKKEFIIDLFYHIAVSNEALSPEVKAEIVEIMKHKNLYDNLAKDKDKDVREAIARRPDLPAEAISILAKDENEDVSSCIAQRRDLPAEVMSVAEKTINNSEGMWNHKPYHVTDIVCSESGDVTSLKITNGEGRIAEFPVEDGCIMKGSQLFNITTGEIEFLDLQESESEHRGMRMR